MELCRYSPVSQGTRPKLALSWLGLLPDRVGQGRLLLAGMPDSQECLAQAGVYLQHSSCCPGQRPGVPAALPRG